MADLLQRNRWARYGVVTLVAAMCVGSESRRVAFAAEPAVKLVVPPSNVPLDIALRVPDGATLAAGAAWQLAGVDTTGEAIPAQRIPATAVDGTMAEGQYALAASIPPATASGPRRFLLQSQPKGDSQQRGFKFVDVDGKSMKLVEGGRPVYAYNYGVMAGENIPANDCRRTRSCYVHPVWGMNGEILTDDFPKDHYHHHGLFWAWPHVKIAGKEHDLWSQAVSGVAGLNGDIEDRFVRWICRDAGPAAAVLAVENGWFVDGKKVMIERVWLRSFSASPDCRSIDLEFVWTPVGAPVTLRGSDSCYGGISMRFAVSRPQDALIRTSAGRQDQDAANVRLGWADLTYPFAGQDRMSGAALFVDPAHPDCPPAWLLRHYGPLCVGWPGVREKTFEPDRPIRLQYRLWIHKDKTGINDLEAAYGGYAAATKVHWESTKKGKAP